MISSQHRARLVHAGRVVVLPDLRQAEAQVLDAADPLGAVDHAALRRRDDLAAGHVDGCHAHPLVDLGDDAGLAALHALEVGEVLDRPLEPAERLRARTADREGDDVELEHVAVELPVQVQAAALVEPAEEVDSGPCRTDRPAWRRTASPSCSCRPSSRRRRARRRSPSCAWRRGSRTPARSARRRSPRSSAGRWSACRRARRRSGSCPAASGSPARSTAS